MQLYNYNQKPIMTLTRKRKSRSGRLSVQPSFRTHVYTPSPRRSPWLAMKQTQLEADLESPTII